MRNSELGTKLDKGKAGGQCGLQGLARQKSLHHTGKKLGSGSELCTLFVHGETTQWTLHQGLTCAPFCGGVMLLDRSRAGLSPHCRGHHFPPAPHQLFDCSHQK